MFSGNGFGGNNNANLLADYVTNSDLQNQFNFAALERQNNENVAAVRQAQLDTVGATKDLAYTNLSQIRDVEAQLQALQASQDSCCCATNRNIDAIRYENAKNTCEIIQAGNANTQAILNFLTNDKIEGLRDDLQSANIALNSQALANSIVQQVRPFPQPAYITCSPYASSGCGTCGSCVCG